VVRENSHRLSDPQDAKVTVVEFVVRYFPLPGHYNGDRAARAVEAAAQQGRLEAMYRTMYETQPEWGERQTPADNVFRDFASGLGLDMTAFDAAYSDPATLERVEFDFNEGVALGVQSTPTFFVDGERVQLRAPDDLQIAVDRALQEA
jgi:protein-disulfide isomerase